MQNDFLLCSAKFTVWVSFLLASYYVFVNIPSPHYYYYTMGIYYCFIFIQN